MKQYVLCNTAIKCPLCTHTHTKYLPLTHVCGADELYGTPAKLLLMYGAGVHVCEAGSIFIFTAKTEYLYMLPLQPY